jgi:hypothetical protein
MNDQSEGKEVMTYFHEVCDCAFKEKEISNDFYRAVRDINLEEFSDIIFEKSEQKTFVDGREVIVDVCATTKPCEAYICCFSMESDSLPMWNYYLKNDRYQGYNLGFDFDVKKLRMKSLELEINCNLFSVIYDPCEKTRLVKNIITSFYDFCSTHNIEYSLCNDYIRDLLQFRKLQFKSEHFTHEKEQRLVVAVPKDSETVKKRYRNFCGYIIPYIELSFNKEMLNSVTIGPLMEQEMSKKALESLKIDYEHNFEIYFSKAPIRY